jgi:hypothetical protein
VGFDRVVAGDADELGLWDQHGALAGRFGLGPDLLDIG